MLKRSQSQIHLPSNFLTELELPYEIENVIACENHITKVSFRGEGGNPTSLVELDLKANRLLELNFNPPKTLEVLDLCLNDYLDFKKVSPALMNIAEVTPRASSE